MDISKSKDDFWAVYNHDNLLIAYANNFIEDNVCHYNSMKFHPKYLNLYPGYALIYTMNEYYLNKKKCSYVSDGARSISHDTNIQEFLIKKFQFRKAYCRLNIVYRWDIGLIIEFLYPFKKILKKINYSLTNKISVILNQETIRKSFE